MSPTIPPYTPPQTPPPIQQPIGTKPKKTPQAPTFLGANAAQIGGGAQGQTGKTLLGQ